MERLVVLRALEGARLRPTIEGLRFHRPRYRAEHGRPSIRCATRPLRQVPARQHARNPLRLVEIGRRRLFGRVHQMRGTLRTMTEYEALRGRQEAAYGSYCRSTPLGFNGRTLNCTADRERKLRSLARRSEAGLGMAVGARTADINPATATRRPHVNPHDNQRGISWRTSDGNRYGPPPLPLESRRTWTRWSTMTTLSWTNTALSRRKLKGDARRLRVRLAGMGYLLLTLDRWRRTCPAGGGARGDVPEEGPCLAAS